MPNSPAPSLDAEGIVRMTADWGRLHLDRPLPWLGVCQVPQQITSSDRAMIEGWPAYLVYSELPETDEGELPERAAVEPSVFGPRVTSLLRSIAEERTRRFGAFLVIELSLHERFQGESFVLVRGRMPHAEVIESLVSGLESIARLGDVPDELSVRQRPDESKRPWPVAAFPGAYWLTIELDPLHFDPETGASFPLVARTLEVALDNAVRDCCFQFARHHTSLSLRTPGAAGRRHPLAEEWGIDRALTRINESYDFLLNITPVNSVEAWHQFADSGFEREPKLRYRPVNVDPEELRRTLFQIPIQHTEDPTLAQLFRAEQEGIDQKLRMLEQRDTPRFIFDSLHLYGTVTDELLRNALELLDTLSGPAQVSRESFIDAREFARIATERIASYRDALPTVTSRVELRDDIASVMVAHGDLLIPKTGRYPCSRIQGLLAHEVGTHIVTYFNGKAQKLQLLAAGLSGADELQEGLAVLAEALTGELTEARLKLLAGRVLAVHQLTQGASFVDVYRELTARYSFGKRSAFGIVLRVFRGGGFTKDAIYLRGLQGLLDYLASGRNLETLLVGKLAFSHIPLVEQLLDREILRPPALIPNYLRRAESRRLLSELRQGRRLGGLLRRRAA